MNINNLQVRYKKNYENIQYGGCTLRASSLYHNALEKKLENKQFENVLEVGAGSGEHLIYIKHDFDRYVISDLLLPVLSASANMKAVEYQENKKVIELKIENIENLTFTDSHFDRVVVTCVLHHLENPLIALQELRRVTRDGGLINVYIPSDPGLMYRILQTIISTRRFRNHFSDSEIRFLRAAEHRNHVASISSLLLGIFSDDEISIRSFPKINFGWNSRIFQIFNIRVVKSNQNQDNEI